MNIQINNVSMTYEKKKEALKNINIEVSEPNLIGLLGPNGAGKSTLMKLMVGQLIPTKGEVLLDNKNILKNDKILKSNLGYLPQSFGLYEELTVYEFLDYIASLKRIKKSKKEIKEALKKTNLTDKKRVKISNLSGGQKQRVGIAQAILGNPKILIFDEPTVGLDPEERINFRNLFSKMADNKIVLLSTHIIEDIQSICNKIIVINKGEVLFTGEPEKLISLAHSHVGIYIEKDSAHEEDKKKYKIISRINSADGIKCRIVGESMPEYAQNAEPTLEDAYMYLLMKSEVDL